MVGRKSSATVQQMQPLVSSTMSSSRQVADPAAGQQLAVHAQFTELVDDQRQPAATGVFQQVADQAGLAGAEKAGNDRRGDLGAQ